MAKRSRRGRSYEVRRLRGLLELAPDAMIVVDEAGKIVLINEQTENVFGYQREELLGRDVEMLLPERFRERHRGHRVYFFAEPRVRPMGAELQLFGLRKAGTEFPAEVSLGPIETGQGVLVASAIRDVTERKLVDEARLRLAAIVDSSDDAIISKTLDGRITSWNAAAQRIFGYAADEAVGQPVSFLIPPELIAEEYAILDLLRGGRHIDHYETVRVTKAGKRVNVSLSISPVKDSSGKIIGVSKIARDITERKLAEESKERFRSVFECSAVGMALVGHDGRWAQVNRALCEMLGYSEQELLGTNFQSLTHPDDLEADLSYAQKVFTGQLRFYHMEKRYIHKQGHVVWVTLTASAVPDASGKVSYGIAQVQDITARKNAEATLRRDKEELHRLAGRLITVQEEERKRIARELHDDINQRLALVAVSLSNLNEDGPSLNSLTKQSFDKVRQEVSNLGKDVQELSHRLHSSKLEYLGLAAAAGGFCKEFSARHNVEVLFTYDNIPRDLPTVISLSLFRVLQEALQNALKYSGTRQFEATLQGTSNEIHLRVHDSGVGFDSESTVNRHGLGLISMNERMKLVDGQLSIDSKSQCGTTIHASVPLSGGVKSSVAES